MHYPIIDGRECITDTCGLQLWDGKAKTLEVGDFHNILLLKNGSVLVWGANYYGQVPCIVQVHLEVR